MASSYSRGNYEYLKNASNYLETELPQTGTAAQQVAGMQGEAVARKLFGAGASQSGAINQRVIQERQAALDQVDPVSTRVKQGANMQTRAARAAANAQGRGLGAGEESQIRRSAEADTSDSLYANRNASLNNLARTGNAIASNTLSTIMGYQGIGTAATPVQLPSSGVSVICTELFYQGYLSEEIMEKDAEFGKNLIMNDIYAYVGYRSFADKIVWLMQRSSIVTAIVAFFGVPWSNNMAGNKNILGNLINKIGIPFCRFIGKVRYEAKTI